MYMCSGGGSPADRILIRPTAEATATKDREEEEAQTKPNHPPLSGAHLCPNKVSQIWAGETTATTTTHAPAMVYHSHQSGSGPSTDRGQTWSPPPGLVPKPGPSRSHFYYNGRTTMTPSGLGARCSVGRLRLRADALSVTLRSLPFRLSPIGPQNAPQTTM